MFFGLYGIAASSMVWRVYDLALLFVGPVMYKKRCNSLSFAALSNYCMSSFVHARLIILVLEVAIHAGSAMLFPRNSSLTLLEFLMILQIFYNVDR